jgi:hypothetical protein
MVFTHRLSPTFIEILDWRFGMIAWLCLGHPATVSREPFITSNFNVDFTTFESIIQYWCTVRQENASMEAFIQGHESLPGLVLLMRGEGEAVKNNHQDSIPDIRARPGRMHALTFHRPLYFKKLYFNNKLIESFQTENIMSHYILD